MKTVLLMRHAQAAGELPGQGDFDRGLTEEGREIALQTGSAITEAGIRIDRVLASSAVRTSQTAQLVAANACPSSAILLFQDLYNAPSFVLEATIRKQMSDAESCLLIIGHNPGIAGVMCRWCGQSLSVPPATLTIFRSPMDQWGSRETDVRSGMVLAGIIQGGQLFWKEALPDFKQTTDG